MGMNITILSAKGPTRLSSRRGGAVDYIDEVAIGLKKLGHNVTILCGAEPKYKIFDSEEIDGVEVIRVGDKTKNIKAIRKYYKKHLREKTDIVLENVVSYYMFTSKFMGKKPHFTLVHHLTGKELFNTHGKLIGIVGYMMEKFGTRLGYGNSKLIAVSEHTKNDLMKNGIKEKNITIVPPGIKDDFFMPGVKDEEPLIVYVGRYDAYSGNKKVDDLIDAFKIVAAKVPNVKLRIAGKGTGVDVLAERSKGYNIKFVGMVSEEEKREYMQKAWVFASPSLAEGFGITWIEANACGTPVVGYKLPNLDTVDDTNSIMVELGNVELLAEALIKMLQDNDLREGMKESCLKNAKKYSWQSSAVKINEYING